MTILLCLSSILLIATPRAILKPTLLSRQCLAKVLLQATCQFLKTLTLFRWELKKTDP